MTDNSAMADFELAMVSDIGTHRESNEDACAHFVENPRHVLFAVADGVGGYEGGEEASAIAVETTLAAYRESAPELGPAERLKRAVRQAGIAIYNRALAVPRLRLMATTLTAAAVDRGVLYAVHIGDCRLYLIRRGRIRRMTVDHTVVREGMRLGLMSDKTARPQVEGSVLSRCLGRDLIVSLDRITTPLETGDRIVLCTDGLYEVLDDRKLERLSRGRAAADACRRLIETANAYGAGDNVTVAFMAVRRGCAGTPAAAGLRSRLGRLLPRRGAG